MKAHIITQPSDKSESHAASTAHSVYQELSTNYPTFVAVGHSFVNQMRGDAMFSAPETNLLVLQSLIAGWIHAQPWFAGMAVRAVRKHPRENVHLMVMDRALEAASDASRFDRNFSMES